jgi:hypothetical protein
MKKKSKRRTNRRKRRQIKEKWNIEKKMMGKKKGGQKME